MRRIGKPQTERDTLNWCMGARQLRLRLRDRLLRNPYFDRFARFTLDQGAEIVGVETLRRGVVLHLIQAGLSLGRQRTIVRLEIVLEGPHDARLAVGFGQRVVIRQVFELMYEAPGVYLFDEFDAIGGARMLDNDVGEMRRVLNAFLQFIEKDMSDSVVFCATNSPELLDQALFRRYDDVLHYTLPNEGERRRLIQNILGPQLPRTFKWEVLLSRSERLSHAEIDLACKDGLKHAILSGTELVKLDILRKMLDERRTRTSQIGPEVKDGRSAVPQYLSVRLTPFYSLYESAKRQRRTEDSQLSGSSGAQ